jgi:4-amino-4-deoxy-L-arabinose transferase-like glycosyltransferase
VRLNPRVLLPVILLVALAARLVFCVAVVGLDAWGWGDEPDYHRHAADIAAGRGFISPEGEPTAARPPLYPTVLGAVYRLFGPSHAAGRILQILLGTYVVFLVYLVAADLLSREAGVVAAAFAAVNPSLVYLSALLMTENLAIVLLLFLLLALARDAVCRESALPRFALGGLIGGLSCLTRPDSALFVLSVPAVALVFGRAPAGRRWAGAAIFVAVAVLTVFPWSARNRVALGEWVPFTTHGGITFYESNNMRIVEEPEFRGSVVLPRTAVPRWSELEFLPEVKFDRKAWQMGRQFVREHADLMPRMMVWKFQRFWRLRSGLRVSGAEGAVAVDGSRSLAEMLKGVDVGWLYSLVAAPLFLLGMAVTARRWRTLALLYAVVVTHTLVALAFHGSLRARSPVEPIIAVFAGATVAALLTRMHLRPRPKTAPGGGAAARGGPLARGAGAAPAAVFAAVALASAAPAAARADDGGRYENTYRKDFIMDAPWMVKSASTPIPITVILKDCDTDDVRELHWIRCWDVTSGQTLVWGHDFGNERIGDDPYESNFWTYIAAVTEGHPTLPNGTPLTPANLGHGPGSTVRLKVQVYYKDDIFNYTETRYLRVRVAQAAWPWPAGWYGGDTHCHTMYTNNIAESGAPVPAIVETAEALGLSWLILTDHSCDLDETDDGSYSYATTHWEYTLQDRYGTTTTYRDNTAIGDTWDVLGAEVGLYSSSALRLARGAEVNLASVDAVSSGKTLHCLFVNDGYVASPLSGAFGERPVTPVVPGGLSQLAADGFAYAAHPASDMSAEWGGLDWAINGALWGGGDFAAAYGYEAFRGVEAFNTRATRYSSDQDDPWDDFDAGVEPDDPYPDELLRGLALWREHLADGLPSLRKCFLTGGSDAHGDFNYSTYLSIDSYATDNALGKVQTVAFAPGAARGGVRGEPAGDTGALATVPAMAEILNAVRGGRCIATDGPFVEIGVDGNGDGDFLDAGDLMMGDDGEAASAASTPLTVRWASSTDFGQVALVELLAGSAAGETAILSLDPSATGQGWSGQATVDLAAFAFGGSMYFRAQCRTANGAEAHRAYANPVWMVFDATDVVDEPALSLALAANPFAGRARLSCVLPSDGAAALAVYDVAGRRVRVMAVPAAGEGPRAPESPEWDGRDDAGAPVAAGVYLFRLTQNGRSTELKGVLLR